MANTDSIVLTTNEAKIILDWDDGQWYVSDIDYSTDSDGSSTSSTSSTVTGGGVKIPEWDSNYKYNTNDIIAYKGILYVSNQTPNQENFPDEGTFWWKPLIDYNNIDALTLEGKNFTELARAILGGNLISDYYKKTEVDNQILIRFNNVDAKKLGGKTLDYIVNDYETKIEEISSISENYVYHYLNDDDNDSFDKAMVDEFNASIVNDDINQI